MTFTCLIQVLRAQFRQPGKRAGLQFPHTPRSTRSLIQSPIWSFQPRFLLKLSKTIKTNFHSLFRSDIHYI